MEKSQNELVRGCQLCTQLSILEGSLAELLRFGRDRSELACGFSARVVAIGKNGTHAVMGTARVLTARVASDRVGRDACSQTWDTCSEAGSVMQFPPAEVCAG